VRVTSVEDRLASLEARVRELEARMGGAGPAPATAAAPSPTGEVPMDDGAAWLDRVSSLAAAGDRAGAIALYRENMASDEQEAASFVDSLVADPPSSR
jgi:hypothetical protein